jgi:hypothetical protein
MIRILRGRKSFSDLGILCGKDILLCSEMGDINHSFLRMNLRIRVTVTRNACGSVRNRVYCDIVEEKCNLGLGIAEKCNYYGVVPERRVSEYKALSTRSATKLQRGIPSAREHP